MKYSTFIIYNVIGAFVWVTSLTFAGYFFGSHPIIKNNFEYMVIGIVLISLIPVFIEYFNHKRSTPKKDPQKAIKDIKEVLAKEKNN